MNFRFSIFDLRFWQPKRKRLELRCVTYFEGDRLIKEGGWTIAPEEDDNRRFGLVYLERLEGGAK